MNPYSLAVALFEVKKRKINTVTEEKDLERV